MKKSPPPPGSGDSQGAVREGLTRNRTGHSGTLGIDTLSGKMPSRHRWKTPRPACLGKSTPCKEHFPSPDCNR